MPVATPVEICNLALSRIGVRRFIESLEDPSDEAMACDAVYEPTRDAALSAEPWPFATRRTVLTALDDVERTGWAYVFTLPSDFLSAQRIESGRRIDPADERIPYVIEANDAGDGLVLACDEEEPELVYTARITVVPMFSPPFVDALAWALAAELAMSLAVKPELLTRATQMAELKLGRAKAVSRNQGHAGPPNDSEFISSRG